MAVPPIEPVYAVSASAEGLMLRVASNGCTRKSDLTVAVSTAPPRALVLVAHKHADTCGKPGAVDIVWSWKELGLEPGQAVNLANPLAAQENR